MDLRVKRTKTNIVNAFIKLRANKPLEKISVKELSDCAFINKATFYAHYKDIYDLSEQLENEVLDKMMNDIVHPEYLILKPKEGLLELMNSIMMQGSLFDTLFSDTRQTRLLEVLERKLKNKITEIIPETQVSLELDILFSVLIRGSFYTFLSYKNQDFNEVIDILGNINERIITSYNFNNI